MIETDFPHIDDLTLTVGDPAVTMLPSEFTRMLYSMIPGDLEGASVLEIGTGGGGLLIALKKFDGAGACVGTDVDPAALSVARTNAALNGVTGIEWLAGPMFEPLRGRKFDLIVCNPASMPDALISDGHREVYRCGGSDGRDMVRSLATESARHLNPGGAVVFVAPGICNIERTLSEMRESGLSPRILYAQIFETNERFTSDPAKRRHWQKESGLFGQLIEAAPDRWYELRYVVLGELL